MFRTDKTAILMATFNGERYVAEQIESILCQTNRDWELFIHDDGSSDRTLEIIGRYAGRCPQSIHVVDGPPTGGARNNFFCLMENVRAPYVMFCDQDDVWLPEKLEKLLARMEETERAQERRVPVLVFSDAKVVDEKLDTIADRLSVYQKLNPNRTALQDLLLQNVATGCAMMLNGACLEKMLVPLDTDAVIMHDWWCALTASCFGSISYVDEPLVLYRQHEGNTIGARRAGSVGYAVDRVRRGKDIRASLDKTRVQAGEFYRAYSLGEDSLPARYSKLGEKNKAQRLLFYCRNKMRKSGFARNLGLMLV